MPFGVAASGPQCLPPPLAFPVIGPQTPPCASCMRSSFWHEVQKNYMVAYMVLRTSFFLARRMLRTRRSALFMQRPAKHVLASIQIMVAVATLLLAPASSASAAQRGMTTQSAADGLGVVARDLTPDEVRSAYLN